jgi:hypothetical protein
MIHDRYNAGRGLGGAFLDVIGIGFRLDPDFVG